jgi:hypothetical protein
LTLGVWQCVELEQVETRHHDYEYPGEIEVEVEQSLLVTSLQNIYDVID